MRGNNQGLIKLVTNAIPRRILSPPPVVCSTSNVSTLLDGNGHLGMLVLKRAVDIAAQKAVQSGVGVVGTINTARCGHRHEGSSAPFRCPYD